MKNNIYTAIPDWFNKVQSQSTDNTSTATTQTTIIGGGGSISMSVHNLFIKSDTTITIDDFTISDLFVTDQITDTENWLTTPLLHTLPNTEVSVTTAAQQLYIGAYDKNNNQIKLYQFSEAISTVVIPENCYYLRASSNKANTDLTIKYVGLNNFDEIQQNKLESSSFQNFLTLVEGDEKGIITNSVQNLSLVFQNPLYYTLDKAGNVLISIDRDALFSQSENPTDDRYVTTVADSVQDILSSKNFKEGLSINGIEIVERNGFLYIKGNLATTGGITAYTDDPDDPGSGGGLPGGGAIGDIVITGSGNALVDASLSEDHSVITFTKGWLVDAESDQSITGIKDFINGIKLDGQLIKIVDGVLWLDCSIATTGGITAYATMPGEGSSSIMDQLVVDTEYFIITEEGVLTIVPGSLGGISNIYVTGNGNALTTVTLSEDGKTVSFTKDKNFADQAEMSAYKAEVNQTITEFKNEVNEKLKRFVTLDTEQEITAVKHFIEGITIGSNKHKFYEKDGVLWLEGDIAITGGITTYATENVDVSTIMDGVAVDEETITKGDDNVLRVKDADAGSSFDENAMWSALASSSDKQINKSHLTTALTGYATETWVIEKGYITSSALNGYATENWVSQNYATLSSLESVSTKLNDFLEGSDTDTIINKWKELEAFLSGMAETDNLAEILETKADKSYVDSTFVTIATKQTITGEKTFSATLNTAAIKASGNITAPSLEVSDYVTIAGIKFRKLENGAILVEGNLAATGGITNYAIDEVDISTVMDGIACDNTTIRVNPDTGVLEVLSASGEAGSVKWNNIIGKPSTFTPSAHTHAITDVTDLQTTLNAKVSSVEVTGTGNAVTAASIASGKLTLTKGATYNNYTHPSATATTITAANGKVLSAITVNNLGHVTSVSSKSLIAADIPTLEISKINNLQSSLDSKLNSSSYTAADVLTKLKTVDGSNSGLDADLLDGIHANKLLTAFSTSSATNLSITVGGTTKTITDLYAYASTKLETARSLWGNNFDGTASISGTIQFTSNEERWLLQTKRSDNTQINGIKTSGYQMCTYFGDTKTMQFGLDRIYSYVDFRAEKDLYINGIHLYKSADGVITLDGNLVVTGGITAYSTGDGSGGSSGGGLDTDLLWELLADSGNQQINKTHLTTALSGYATESWVTSKNYLTSVKIATISDLHSSWDSVLAAQKPNWLTAVSIATISDLHANWDALLKAAPSAYVTRWPTISEVTGKQNLIVKLNGGTTEGTNQFTYNATGAKTINITPAGIGAAASSHNHAWADITSGKPTTLAGYGITDGVNYVSVTGGGNAITSASISGHSLTLTKGSTFLLSSQYTAADILAKLKTVDGAGSDLEADILALTGETGSMTGTNLPARVGMQVFQYYQNGNGPTNYGNFLRIRGNGGGCGELFLGWDVSNNTSNIWYKSKRDTGYWGSWRQVAFTDMNVASATKLQTAQNIWGQSFDGTNPITGSLSNVTDINASGKIQAVRFVASYIPTTGLSSPNFYNDSNAVLDFSEKYTTVNLNTIQPIIRWGNSISGYGYQTKYMIGSVRDQGNWGGIYMAVSNNDAGTSTGSSLAIYGGGYIEMVGNLLVSGGGTFYSSDIRYKSIMQQVNLSLLDIAKAPSFVYHWNKQGMKCDRLNIGGSAQYTKTILPWAVEEKNNLLTMDYATVAYTFAVHTARHLLTYESRTDKKIKKLENRVKYLEKQLKKLGYEEANIVDN